MNINPTRDAVTLYRRTYMSVLRSSGDIPVRALMAAHAEMGSSLHPNAADANIIDAGALLYAIQRLPDCIEMVNRIVLAQLPAQFESVLGPSVRRWTKVQAPARRRLWSYDGQHILAVYLTSPSDLDDMIPTVTAYQLEWNKIHHRLNMLPHLRDRLLALATDPSADFSPAALAGGPPDLLIELDAELREALQIDVDDWDRLARAWGLRFWEVFTAIARAEKHMTVRLIGGTHTAYAKVVAAWWQPILRQLERRRLLDRPLYVVSSNPHGLVNLCSGYVRRRGDRLTALMDALPEDDPEAADLREAAGWSNRDNVLYYLNRLWSRFNPGHNEEKARRTAEEEERGIYHLNAAEGVDVAGQIIELRRLRAADLDPRLGDVAADLVRSRAVVLNIDYPLGLAAYRILRTITESVDNIRGIYVVGKAATLNGAVGDVLISNTVYDEHSQNIYTFPNAFGYADVAPYLARGSVLDRQKAVTVRSTFLQNREYLDLFYRENYTVVEMEAGPYLSAIYEATQPIRHPIGEHIHFQALPFDLGIIHYASDTPYTRVWTLGVRNLSFAGIDSTYASTVAVLRRIAKIEAAAPRPPPIPRPLSPNAG
ncbi:MAG: hypothetical protein NTZ05_00855, partial [Chloroflexi bacterium]|nr:hypothetical protein [Chloroflexota bacterium]